MRCSILLACWWWLCYWRGLCAWCWRGGKSNGVDGVCVQPLVARQALGVYEARVRALLDEVVAEVRVVVLEGEVQAGVARVVLVVL